jgi:hypothetical protein
MGFKRPFRRTIFKGNFALKDMNLGQKIGFQSRGAFFLFLLNFFIWNQMGVNEFRTSEWYGARQNRTTKHHPLITLRSNGGQSSQGIDLLWQKDPNIRFYQKKRTSLLLHLYLKIMDFSFPESRLLYSENYNLK